MKEIKLKLHGKRFICKTSRLLDYLVKLGFKPVITRRDLFNPAYMVWEFEVSEELREAVEKYFNRSEARKNYGKD